MIYDRVIKSLKVYQISLYVEIQRVSQSVRIVERRRFELKEVITKNWQSSEIGAVMDVSQELHIESTELHAQKEQLLIQYDLLASLINTLESGEDQLMKNHYQPIIDALIQKEEFELCHLLEKEVFKP